MMLRNLDLGFGDPVTLNPKPLTPCPVTSLPLNPFTPVTICAVRDKCFCIDSNYAAPFSRVTYPNRTDFSHLINLSDVQPVLTTARRLELNLLRRLQVAPGWVFGKWLTKVAGTARLSPDVCSGFVTYLE